MISGSHRFPTYHIPDDGTRYAGGETVRIDRSASQVQIIKDAAGDHEVMSCRKATEYGDDPPLLRVDLRKLEAKPTADPNPAGPWSPYDR